MRRKNVFVQVSGDEYLNLAFLKWVKSLSKRAWIVIGIGGGTQINEEFTRRGFPVKTHGPMGREMDTFEERQVQRDVLEANQEKLQNWFAKEKIFAAVEIPVVMIGTVLCPINGDQMVRNAYIGFDEVYRVTTSIKRAKEKASMFTGLPKVKVLYESNGILKQLCVR